MPIGLETVIQRFATVWRQLVTLEDGGARDALSVPVADSFEAGSVHFLAASWPDPSAPGMA